VNLFATILTYPAPTANYRGESELNRTVIQKVTDGRFDYPIISPEAMRNALREILAGYGLPCNRARLHDEEQLAVTFKDYPDPSKYAADFFFGYFIAAGSADRKKILKEVKEAGRDGFAFKRDSVLRMNLAKGLEPYRHDAVFTQSPVAAEGSKYKNAATSALLHRETAVTAFQYPVALNLNDCRAKPEWTRALLRALGELSNVAGNHARSYYEMAPASLVVRLTDSLVAGYDTYGFRIHTRPAKVAGQPPRVYHRLPEVVRGILHEPDPDYPGAEFYLGGKIVKDMPEARREQLRGKGVKLERDPRRLLAVVADKALGG
jgi:CRISPR-associated protein Cst2